MSKRLIQRIDGKFERYSIKQANFSNYDIKKEKIYFNGSKRTRSFYVKIDRQKILADIHNLGGITRHHMSINLSKRKLVKMRQIVTNMPIRGIKGQYHVKLRVHTDKGIRTVDGFSHLHHLSSNYARENAKKEAIDNALSRLSPNYDPEEGSGSEGLLQVNPKYDWPPLKRDYVYFIDK